jgi:predicted permease
MKGFVTPPLIALFAGVLGGLIGIKGYIPQFFMTFLSGAADCMGPVAMVLAGFVIGGYSMKSLITNKRVYVASVLRLILIPALLLTVFHLIGADKDVLAFILIAFASPLGLNTIVYPAAYGGDTSTGASMALISNILGIVTIPLMYYVFIVLL